MFLSKYESQIYALLRIVTGFLFLWHGSQKLFSLPPAGHPFPPHVMYIGGIVEFFGGLLVMIGFGTRYAAFICSGEMAYAYWTVHALNAALPLLNMGELAVVYCFLFLYISARGSGEFSIDRLLAKR